MEATRLMFLEQSIVHSPQLQHKIFVKGVVGSKASSENRARERSPAGRDQEVGLNLWAVGSQ